MNIEDLDLANELNMLREENARLKELLEVHGIPVEGPSRPDVKATEPKEDVPILQLTLEEKVDLFLNTFQGRGYRFARRWFSSSTGKSGYQPVCLKEWNRKFCDKKKYKCAECPNREFKELGYEEIYRQLEGRDPTLDEKELQLWSSLYRVYGEEVFMNNQEFGLTLRRNIIADKINNGLSLIQTCVKYKILSRSSLRNWLRSYKSGSLMKQGSKKKKDSVSLSSETEKIRLLEEELFLVKAENAFLKKLQALMQKGKKN